MHFHENCVANMCRFTRTQQLAVGGFRGRNMLKIVIVSLVATSNRLQVQLQVQVGVRD